jgi:hypothetical protein
MKRAVVSSVLAVLMALAFTSCTPPVPEQKKIGYVMRVFSKDGKTFLDLDPVEWYVGAEAINAWQEDNPSIDATDENATPPSDFYIRNRERKIETFQLTKKTVITMQTYSSNPAGEFVPDQAITQDEFKELFPLDDAQPNRYETVPFWIEATMKGVVTSINEQLIK